MDITAAVRYPTEQEDWLQTIAIGGILTIFGFLLFPLFLVYGYLVRTIRERADGETEPPVFEDWGTLFVDGLQAWIIGIVYMLVPGIVAVVTVGGSIAAIATGTQSGATAGIAGLLGGLAITSLLVLLFGYVAVAGIVNFACEQRFGAAFDIGKLGEIVLTAEYAVAWIVSVVVFLVAGVVAGALNAVPLLGFVVGAFVFFYADIVVAGLWADGYTAALSGEDVGTTGRREAAV